MYCHLEGSQGFVGMIVAEIPPGKSLKPITTSKEPARQLALRRGLRHVGHPWRPNPSVNEDEPP